MSSGLWGLQRPLCTIFSGIWRLQRPLCTVSSGLWGLQWPLCMVFSGSVAPVPAAHAHWCGAVCWIVLTLECSVCPPKEEWSENSMRCYFLSVSWTPQIPSGQYRFLRLLICISELAGFFVSTDYLHFPLHGCV